MATAKQQPRQSARVRKIDYDRKPKPEPEEEVVAAPVEDPAEAAEVEATGKRTVLQVPLGDGDVLELVLPQRWRRFAFMRSLARGDMWGALETLGLEDDQLDKLDQAEVDEEEFQLAMDRLGESLTGKRGKSRTSRR